MCCLTSYDTPNRKLSLTLQVAAVPEDVGTAGALRAIAHHLTAKDIMVSIHILWQLSSIERSSDKCRCFMFLQVVSGDLVSDVPPGAVAAAHRRHDAVVTAMLCSAPVSGPSDSGPSGGKDKTKKPGRYNLIGLDPTKQFLLYIATGIDLQNCSFFFFYG